MKFIKFNDSIYETTGISLRKITAPNNPKWGVELITNNKIEDKILFWQVEERDICFDDINSQLVEKQPITKKQKGKNY